MRLGRKYKGQSKALCSGKLFNISTAAMKDAADDLVTLPHFVKLH